MKTDQKDNRRSRKSSNVSRYDEMWMGMFQKLVEYEKQHNNTLVPRTYNGDPKLGTWVSYQRHAYKNNKLLRSS